MELTANINSQSFSLRLLAVGFCLIGMSAVSGEARAKRVDDRLDAVRAKAGEVLSALKAVDLNVLSTLAHPQKGIRFSPYGYVDAKSDRRLLPQEIRTAATDKRTHRWGNYDGSGDPIQLTLPAYLQRFGYDKDFLQRGEAFINPSVQRGNSKDNVAEIYPSGTRVEYFIPATEQNGEKMLDWASLTVVLEEFQGVWYVVAIVHDQWTI
jgi:hypothetical protein